MRHWASVVTVKGQRVTASSKGSDRPTVLHGPFQRSAPAAIEENVAALQVHAMYCR
jgi:hypothetical protein